MSEFDEATESELSDSEGVTASESAPKDGTNHPSLSLKKATPTTPTTHKRKHIMSLSLNRDGLCADLPWFLDGVDTTVALH